MKILILAPYYYPKENPRAFRWNLLSSYWASQQNEVTVLCANHFGTPKYEIVDGVKILRAGYVNVLDMWKSLFLPNKQKLADNKERRSSVLHFVYQNTLKKLHFPDEAFVWIPYARSSLRRLAKIQQFELIVSVGLPFSAHIVGLTAKKYYPNSIWIQDIGDPFAVQSSGGINNLFLYKNLNYSCEKRTMQTADVVFHTNSGAQKLYQKIYPQASMKMQVANPVFKPIELKIKKKIGKGIELAYFGSFFSKIRPSKLLVQFLDMLLTKYPEFRTQVKLHYYGNSHPDQMAPLLKLAKKYPSAIFLHLPVSRRNALELMTEMTALISIGNKTCYQLPSKTVDYLQSRTPIFHILQHKHDPCIEVYQPFSHVHLLDNSIENQVDKFMKIIHKTGLQSGNFSDLLLEPYKPSSVGQKMLNWAMANRQ